MSLEYQLMSNEEFLNYIPEKTKKYVSLCEKYYSKIREESVVMLNNDVLCFLASVYAIMKYDSKYKNFFEKNGFIINHNFEEEKVIIDGFLKKVDLGKNDSSDIISKFRVIEERYCDNTILTPIKIVYYLYYMCDDNSLRKYFDKFYDYHKFKDRLDEVVQKEKKEILNGISGSYFNKKIFITEKYLTEVAYVYYLLDKSKSKIGIDIDSYKTFAYFAALFKLNGNDEDVDVLQSVIKNYDVFKKKDLNFEKIMNKIGINGLYCYDITPVLVLNKHFKELDKNYTDISTIFYNNILNDEKGVIKRLFNIDNDELKDLYEKLKALDLKNNLLTREEYFKQLNPDVINYLDDCYRIYKYIMSNNSTKDGIIIQSELDYRVLSMLLVSLNRDSNISKYLKKHNIDTNYICNLLNINLDDNKYKDINIESDNNEVIIKFYSLLSKIKINVKVEEDLNLSMNVDYSSVTIDNIEGLLTDSSILETRIINRIYNVITSKNLPDNWKNVMYSEVNSSEMVEKNKLIEEIFSGYNLNVYKYLSSASIIFNNIKDIIKNDNDSADVSLLLAVSELDSFNENSMYKYMQLFGYNNKKIKEYFSIKNNIYEGDIDPFVIKEYYSKYLYRDIEKYKMYAPRKSDVNPPSILNEVLNNVSFRITKVFNSIGVNYNGLKNFSPGYYSYNEKRIKMENMNIIKQLRDDNIFCYFNDAFSFYKRVEDEFARISCVVTKNDIKYVSLLLAVLDSKNIYCDILKNEGITYNSICNKLNEGVSFKIDYEYEKYQVEKEICEIYKHFIKYIYDGTNLCDLEKNKTKKDVGFIVRRLFDDNLTDNKVIKRLIDNETYNLIYKKIYNEKIVDNALSSNEIIEQLNKQVKELDNLRFESLEEALTFILEGDTVLSKYSEYILNQVRNIGESLDLDYSLSTIDELADNIYIDTPVKQGILARIFSSNDIKRELNHKVLDNLSKELENESDTLSIQVKKYREIFKTLKVYIDSIYKYKNFSKNYLSLYEIALSHIPDDDTTYSKRLSYKQVIDGFSEKISGYERTITLMNTQLFQIYQAINNHIITHNALKISKNVIVPMISSGVLFTIGDISQKKAIALSNSLVGLFKTAIAQDVNGVNLNLKNLKSVDLPQGTIDNIINCFDNFIDEVNNSKKDLLELSSNNNDQTKEDIKVKKIGKKGSN